MSEGYGLAHSGEVFRRCRNARAVSLQAIPAWSGLSAPTVSNIELRTPDRNGAVTRPNRSSVWKYIEALGHKEVNPPLTNDQADFLRFLFEEEHETKKREDDLAHLKFNLIASRSCPPKLREMVTQLRELDRPAILLDPLWNIHAINGLVPELFEVDKNADILHRWEGWHSLGIKLYKVSPLQISQPYVDNFIGQTLQFFFMNRFVAPYHFTQQMHAIMERIGRLAADQKVHSFAIQWRNVTSLMTHYDENEKIRTLRVHSGEIQADGDPIDTCEVEILPEIRIPFLLLGWKPTGSDAHEVFDKLRASPNRGQVLRACDYDKRGDFHVNTWPEIRTRMSARP